MFDILWKIGKDRERWLPKQKLWALPVWLCPKLFVIIEPV